MDKEPKNNALVSIVVPVSQMAGSLDNFKKWTSDLNQNYQLIVVHDIRDLITGAELLEHLSTKVFCPYIFIEDRYGSPGAARNAGKQLAQGKWIVFWDSDDFAYVEVIDRWLGQNIGDTNKPEIDLIVFRFTRFDLVKNNVREQQIWKEDASKNELSWLTQPGIWRCLFRREVTNDLLFPKVLMGEDQIFLIDVLKKGIQPIFSNDVVYQYITGRVGQSTNNRSLISEMILSREELRLRRNARNKIAQRAGEILWLKFSLSCLAKLPLRNKKRIILELVSNEVFKLDSLKLLTQIIKSGSKL
jgi:glycosyltransferase involved in cell wall biosynthesis